MTVQLFRLAHACFHVATLHEGDEVESNRNFFNTIALLRNTNHPQSRNTQEMLSSEKLKG